MSAYRAALNRYRQEQQEVAGRAKALQEDILSVTGGSTLSQKEQFYAEARKRHQNFAEARRAFAAAQELVQALQDTHREAPAPNQPDALTYTEQETLRLLSDCAYEQRQLQQRLDNTLGKSEALGQEPQLRKQLEEAERRIQKLEDTCAALELAQDTLSAATAQLQRRFAPKITQRAKNIFEKLTDGRYTRLTLEADLSVQALTQSENTLRSVLWRSDGTVDQLYLALRLAMAEALTPEAPLILDDALVRFDDHRLALALAVLQDEARGRQVILFTCQNRESRILYKE